MRHIRNPPEVLQCRSGNHRAALAVPLAVPILYRERIESLGRKLGSHCNFFHALALLGIEQPFAELSLLLLKILRPATLQDVEWNTPGGVVETHEDPKHGMVREFKEEVRGLKVLGTMTFFENLQFGSGVYRELYDIGVVIAFGIARQPNCREGIMESCTVLLSGAMSWMETHNSADIRNPEFCGVDGKVVMVIERLEGELRSYHLR